MQDSQYIEFETNDKTGVICGEVHVTFKVEDDSFDHEFGTEKVLNTALDEEEGIDVSDLRYATYDNEEKLVELSEEYKYEAENTIEGLIAFPSPSEVAESFEPDF